MTPYPLIYTPKGWKSATGASKPACCPHAGALAVMSHLGPDAVAEEDGSFSGGGGLLWGGDRLDGGEWRRTPAGWWAQFGGHQPQHLVRLGRNPRVTRRVVIFGDQPGHKWSVPVLLEHVDGAYRSAVNGIWDGEGYHAGELADVQSRLLAAASGLDLHPNADQRNAAIRQLACDLLAIDQWWDLDLAAASGWLSEKVILDTILAASPSVDHAEQAIA